MTVRKPVVIVNGQLEQLQSGDSISGTTAVATSLLTNDEAGAVVSGTPVYADAADGYKKARANATGTSIVVGLQQEASVATSGTGTIQHDGPLTLSTAAWDAVTGDTGGLTFNSYYWLDPATAGKLTKTAPTTVGHLVCPVGRALSTTELLINIGITVLL